MKCFNQASIRYVIWMLVFTGLLCGTVAHAVFEPSPLSDPSRRWAISAAASGGYDDNIFDSPSDSPNKKSSATSVLESKFYVNYPMDQTFLGLRYAYNAIYYWDRSGGDPWDQSHVADFIFSHRFNPRLQLDLTDNFRRGLSPELVNIANGTPYISQQQGDYFYNYLNAALTYNISRLWTLTITTGWETWSYDNPAVVYGNDRNVYSPGIGLNYTLSPSTTLGIEFHEGIVDYSNPGANDAQNSHSETVYLTLMHQFNPQLSGQINVGGSVAEYGDGTGNSSPYASGSVTYRYAVNGTATLGTSYFLYTSDQNGFRSAETLATFLQVNQSLTPKLTATLGLNYIHSLLSNPDPTIAPTVAGEPSSDAWRLNLGLSYACTHWFSLDLNYSFDTVTSQIPGNSFDRNRVSAGVRFTY